MHGFLTKNALINVAIVVSTLVIICLIGETSIRVLEANHILPVHDSIATKAAIKRSRQLNARLVRSQNPVLYLEYDTRHKEINNAGHRGPDIVVTKSPQVYRIAILGDSIAYGYSVPLDKTFSTVLQRELDMATSVPSEGGRRFEVMNFAVSGYGTEAELELFKTKVIRYKPDLVLLAYTLNDPAPTQLVLQTVSDSRKKMQLFSDVARRSHFFAWLLSVWDRAVKGMRVENTYRNFYTDTSLWVKVQNSIAELKSITSANHIKLSAVIFPVLLPYDQYPLKEYHSLVAAEFEKNNIPHMDLLDIYSHYSSEQLKISEDDTTHPNEFGHQIAADAIYQFLIDKFPAAHKANTGYSPLK